MVCILGVTIRIIARKTLGKSFTYGLRVPIENTLIKKGIYKYIQHPAYSGSILFCQGFTLIFNSLFGFLTMLPLLLFFLFRIGIEEDILIKEFGDEYREYIKRSKKLIPYLY